MSLPRLAHILILTIAATAFSAAPLRAAEPTPGSAPAGKIDFAKQIRPMLETSCAQCHLNGKRKGGLRLDSRELLLKGGDSGAAVAVHEPDKSLIIERVTSKDPDEVMPKKGPKLTVEQVAILRAWVNQGLPWEGGAIATSRPTYVAPIAPRRPTLPAAPAGSDLHNPIDLFLHQSQPKIVKTLVDDRVYVRRVYLDANGLLPTAEQVEAFVADAHPDKREQLVERLLADNRQYAENWLSFWNDALRNDYQGTGYIDGGRKQITAFLYRALSTNMPYDQFVRDLVNPVPGAEGFTNGIVWRGAVSASQRKEIQAAQSISQVFLGVNMKCNSCHDSFISDWKLSDAYGMAGVYADRPLEMFRCEKATGKIAPVQFLYPELGTIDGTAPRAQRIQRLAALMTSNANGRFSRTMINRIWARFLGHGLVEPVDEMDREPWNADLLDWLASDLADNGYDLKKTIALILTSRAYQMPSAGLRERGEEYAFEGPVVRRLSAEQFCDAVWQLTDGWPAKASTDAYPAAPSSAGPPSKARWIWKDAKAATATEGLTIYLRKTFELPAVPASAHLVATCDNRFTLFVNGKQAAAGALWSEPQSVDIKPFLVHGANVFAVVATNDIPETPNPAGFWLSAMIRQSPGSKPMEIASGTDWKWSLATADGWYRADFAAQGWQSAADLGDASIAPWNLSSVLAQQTAAPSAATPGAHVRAVWVNRDALMTALGRPNREQVSTSRTTYATMLQALELTNGPELSQLLQRGAKYWMQRRPGDGKLIDALFRESLGRAPTADERSMSEQIVGSPLRQEGVEDLLWSILMLPEFQLIH